MDEFQISGWEARMNVKRAFDALYMRLGKELEAATSCSDMDLQLILLNAWGLIMKPEDHALLLQVRLFDNLHAILAQPEDDFILADDNSSELKSLRRLKRAAMKLVVLLATQVRWRRASYIAPCCMVCLLLTSYFVFSSSLDRPHFLPGCNAGRDR